MRKILLASIIFAMLCGAAQAEYLYVKTTGSGGSRTTTVPASFGWANDDCYGSISTAESAMQGGDEMVIDDGTYPTSSITVNGIDGSAGNYTVIRARNDWGVTLDISSGFGFNVQDSYLVIRGIHTGGGVFIQDQSHVKILRCSATFSGGTWTFIAGSNNGTTGSSYCLFEECFAFGGSHRYMFGAGGPSHHIVVRRCVGRWDYSTFGLGYPLAVFANYANTGEGYVSFQNCIAIDGTNHISFDGVYRGTKAFKTPNSADNTFVDGCIVLNFDGPGFFLEEGSSNFSASNSIVWDLTQTDTSATYAVSYGLRTWGNDDNLAVNNLTMGDNQTGNNGIRLGAAETGSILNDSIFYSISGTAVGSGFATQTDNLFYGNGSNGTVGTGAITATDPTAERLLYLPRIETGDQGATISYRIGSTASTTNEVGGVIDGLSGKLYSETGWNTLTDQTLWPFPNEAVIKTKCAAFSMAAGAAYTDSPAMDGARGFAADTVNPRTTTGKVTLTSYIWEYLGNTGATAGIYGLEQSHRAVGAPSGGSWSGQ